MYCPNCGVECLDKHNHCRVCGYNEERGIEARIEPETESNDGQGNLYHDELGLIALIIMFIVSFVVFFFIGLFGTLPYLMAFFIFFFISKRIKSKARVMITPLSLYLGYLFSISIIYVVSGESKILLEILLTALGLLGLYFKPGKLTVTYLVILNLLAMLGAIVNYVIIQASSDIIINQAKAYFLLRILATGFLLRGLLQLERVNEEGVLITSDLEEKNESE